MLGFELARRFPRLAGMRVGLQVCDARKYAGVSFSLILFIYRMGSSQVCETVGFVFFISRGPVPLPPALGVCGGEG